MLFEKLVIENYGVYKGRSEFDLSTTPDRPIVLVGGLNGAGKTTIFESIMIALYGRSYTGKKTHKEYVSLIADKVHRHGGQRAKNASVEVTFRFYHGGTENVYSVLRHWLTEGATVEEELRVSKNGSVMRDMDESMWQSFIESLIPPGIARLFFFDGEKVVRITEWNKHQNTELKASIERLLGADLIHRLRSDLTLYSVRKSGTGKNGTHAKQRYEQQIQEKCMLADAISDLEAERDEKMCDLDEISIQIKSAESKMADSGGNGNYVDRRARMLNEQGTLQEKAKQLRKDIHEAFAEDTPLYLVSSLLSEVVERIEEDLVIRGNKAAVTIISEKVADIKTEIRQPEFWPERFDSRAIVRRISSRLDSLIQLTDKDEFFDVSPTEASLICQKAAVVRGGSHTVSKMLDTYAKTASDLDRVAENLTHIPKDDEIGPRISHINEMHRKMGVLESEIAHLDRQISTKSAHKKIIQSKIRDTIKGLHGSDVASSGINLASRMCSALDTYYERLSEKKICELESHLLDTANALLHKDMLSKINIDRETFEITVYGKDGEPILGGLLSMGERQIIGTALTWAIARTTGRSLPFVIDTPLGRLDGTHLENLTDRFYPVASHQTILLSTDREIGRREYRRLSGYVSNAYRITCDPVLSETTVSRGYFSGVKKRQVKRNTEETGTVA